MPTLIFIAIAGFAAQLVDGGIGMGFGVTSTTLLLFLAGLGPAQASAVFTQQNWAPRWFPDLATGALATWTGRLFSP